MERNSEVASSAAKNRECSSELDGGLRVWSRVAVTVVDRGLTICSDATPNTCVSDASSIDFDFIDGEVLSCAIGTHLADSCFHVASLDCQTLG
jgi:hypothetical protein